MTELTALDDSDVSSPTLPISVALQEANDLSVLLTDEAVSLAMAAVGVVPEQKQRLASLIDVCREAQSRWMVARDLRKGQVQKELEASGEEMRAQLIAACRWNLRGIATAQATLGSIAEGTGVADLVQDLSDLGELVGKHAASFALDQTFDAAARAESAHHAASELAAGASDERHSATQRQAKALRDRAHTLLAEQVADLRGAGRYAHRESPGMLRKFGSEHARRRRRRRTVGVAAVTEEVAVPS